MPDDSSDHGADQLRLRAALNRWLLARRSPDERERLDARLDLVEVLADAGWEPPPAVQAALRADEQARGVRRSA